MMMDFSSRKNVSAILCVRSWLPELSIVQEVSSSMESERQRAAADKPCLAQNHKIADEKRDQEKAEPGE
jgi:hypothetical protein